MAISCVPLEAFVRQFSCNRLNYLFFCKLFRQSRRLCFQFCGLCFRLSCKGYFRFAWRTNHLSYRCYYRSFLMSFHRNRRRYCLCLVCSTCLLGSPCRLSRCLVRRLTMKPAGGIKANDSTKLDLGRGSLYFARTPCQGKAYVAGLQWWVPPTEVGGMDRNPKASG